MKLLKNNQNLFIEISDENYLYNNLILDKYMNIINTADVQIKNGIFSTINSPETMYMKKHANEHQEIITLYYNATYDALNKKFTSFTYEDYGYNADTQIRKIFEYTHGSQNSNKKHLIYNLKNKYHVSAGAYNGGLTKYFIDNYDFIQHIGINNYNKVIYLNDYAILEWNDNIIYFKFFDESSYKFHIIKEIPHDELILSLGKEYNGNIIIYGNEYISEIKVINNEYILEYENEYIDDDNLNLVLKNCTDAFNKQYKGNLNIEIMSNNAIFVDSNTNKITVNYNKGLNIPVIRNNKGIVTYKITVV